MLVRTDGLSMLVVTVYFLKNLKSTRVIFFLAGWGFTAQLTHLCYVDLTEPVSLPNTFTGLA